VTYLHPSARKNKAAAQPGPGLAGLPAEPARLANQACCCPAKAVVRVTMPTAAVQPRETDLLLCGHHYRVSRQALAAASATVRGLVGTPRDIAAWIEPDRPAALTEG
jgi:hypothetical protein